MGTTSIRKIIRIQDDPERWKVICKACSKRMGGERLFSTEQDCRKWWTEHLETKRHRRAAAPVPIAEATEQYRQDVFLAHVLDVPEPTPPPAPSSGRQWASRWYKG